MTQGLGPETDEGFEALEAYLDDFDPTTQQRGRAYFKAGRVSGLSQTGNRVHAHVRGSYEYETSLYCTKAGWHSECTCPMKSNCKHVYATGLAWLQRYKSPALPGAEGFVMSDPAPSKPILKPNAPELRLLPGEESLVAEFSAATGHEPDRKELAFLRNLASVHRSLGRSSYGWFDNNALVNLAPNSERLLVKAGGYGNPFQNWFAQNPATPLQLWPFIALLFTESGVTLPPFTEPFNHLEEARREREKCRQNILIKQWQQRFSQLDEMASATPAQLVRQTVRLRLAMKKPVWEISSGGPFATLSADRLRDMLEDPVFCAQAVDDTSNVLLNYLRANYEMRGHSSVSLTDHEDRVLLGQLLANSRTRTLVVGPAGEPIVDDPRPVTWRIDNHPDNPTLSLVSLALHDGSTLPSPLIYLPGRPAFYLHQNHTLFQGLPPAIEPTKSQLTDFAAELPRAALELPEAGRYAARAGFRLPGKLSERFRHETLRARLRARLAPRRDDPADEVLVVELHALSPEGSPRARCQPEGWRTDVPGLDQPADKAFLLHDYGPLASASAHLAELTGLRWDGWAPEAGRYATEIAGKTFPAHFADWLAAAPTDLLIELSPELASFAKAPDRASVVIEIAEGSDIDWFDVHTSLRVEDTSLTEKEIELLMKAKGGWVRLAKHGWRRLSVESTADETTRAELDRLGINADADFLNGKNNTHRYHTLQLANSVAAARDDAMAARLRERAATLRAIVPPALPVGLNAELRPYQEEGYQFLAHLASLGLGGVLADDMGLGKTLQTLAWFLWLRECATAEKRSFRALVVCPKSVVPNWQLETVRFTPALSTARFDPEHPGLPEVNLLVINYAQLRLRADTLLPIHWDAVVLDEGQNIKNPASSTARTARELTARHRLVLTGTPIENRLLDLWSLLAFAQPGLLGSQASFQRLYREKDDPVGARSRLATRVRPFLLRRTKSQVAKDLPPRVEEEIFCELEGEQRTLYDAELKRARQMLLQVKTARQFDTERFNILQSLLRLRQICCDPRLVGLGGEKPEAAKKRRTVIAASATQKPPVSAKMEALLDTIEPLVEEGHRVLVFSQFVTMLELIQAELNRREISHLILTGQTENRQELVDLFQSPAGPPVFLLSLKAAGSGLNLTAASYVILYDPWWNPAVEAQAIDRTHRIGQTSKVNAYRLLAKNTIEEKIRALQHEKAAMAAAVVKEESLTTVLDLDSLRKILS